MRKNDAFLFEMKLANSEQLASVIGILGYIILIISAQQAKNQLVMEHLGVKGINTGSPQSAFVSTWIRFIAFALLAVLALARLEQRSQDIQAGRDTAPLTPNINITLGAWIIVIGVIFEVIGTKQRAEQPPETAPITII